MPFTGLDISSPLFHAVHKGRLNFLNSDAISNYGLPRANRLFSPPHLADIFSVFRFGGRQKDRAWKSRQASPTEPQTKMCACAPPSLLSRRWLTPRPHRKKTTNGRKPSAARASFCAAASKMFFRTREMITAGYRTSRGKFEIFRVFVVELS
jgi:hypothetical protein